MAKEGIWQRAFRYLGPVLGTSVVVTLVYLIVGFVFNLVPVIGGLLNIVLALVFPVVLFDLIVAGKKREAPNFSAIFESKNIFNRSIQLLLLWIIFSVISFIVALVLAAFGLSSLLVKHTFTPLSFLALLLFLLYSVLVSPIVTLATYQILKNRKDAIAALQRALSSGKYGFALLHVFLATLAVTAFSAVTFGLGTLISMPFLFAFTLSLGEEVFGETEPAPEAAEVKPAEQGGQLAEKKEEAAENVEEKDEEEGEAQNG